MSPLATREHAHIQFCTLQGDVKEAFRGAHTLKGVCQNLGFSNLYAPTYTLTETLRAGQLEGTQEQFAKVAEQYKRTVDAIRALD